MRPADRDLRAVIQVSCTRCHTITHVVCYVTGKLVDSQFDDTSEAMLQRCTERYFEHIPLVLHSAFE